MQNNESYVGRWREDKCLSPSKSPLGGKKKSMLQDLGNLLHNKSHYLKAEDISETLIQKWSSCVICMWWVKSVKACDGSWFLQCQRAVPLELWDDSLCWLKAEGMGEYSISLHFLFSALPLQLKGTLHWFFSLLTQTVTSFWGVCGAFRVDEKKQHGSRGWGKGSEGWYKMSVFKTGRKTLFFWWQGCQSKLWCSTKSIKQVQEYKTESTVLTDGNSSYMCFPIMSLK